MISIPVSSKLQYQDVWKLIDEHEAVHLRLTFGNGEGEWSADDIEELFLNLPDDVMQHLAIQMSKEAFVQVLDDNIEYVGPASAVSRIVLPEPIQKGMLGRLEHLMLHSGFSFIFHPEQVLYEHSVFKWDAQNQRDVLLHTKEDGSMSCDKDKVSSNLYTHFCLQGNVPQTEEDWWKVMDFLEEVAFSNSGILYSPEKGTFDSEQDASIFLRSFYRAIY